MAKAQRWKKPAATTSRSWTPPPRQAEQFPPTTYEEKVAVVKLASTWYRQAGSREQDIMQRYGVTTTRFYQVLNLLIDEPEVIEACPAECKRFQEQRGTRARVRAAVRRKQGRYRGRLPTLGSAGRI